MGGGRRIRPTLHHHRHQPTRDENAQSMMVIISNLDAWYVSGVDTTCITGHKPTSISSQENPMLALPYDIIHRPQSVTPLSLHSV